MSEVRDLLCRYVDSGAVPGAVALIDHGGRVEVATAGRLSIDEEQEIAEDSIFRIASLTKPITAVAVMMLVEDGLISLDDPIARWLPELAAPRVVRAPDAPIEDTVPARRPITVFDLLTFRAGYGFGEDFSLPALQPMFTDLHQGAPSSDVLAPDEWISRLARIPMLHQPGETWLYNTCSDIQGVLIARVAGTPLPQFLTDRIFEPLGMSDTAFAFPAADQARVTSSYRFDANGALSLSDGPDGDWRTVPAFPSGAGGLLSTAGDWHAFGRMLLAGGSAAGHQLLSPESVAQLTTDHLSAAQRSASTLFLEGQGWGFGGSVDVEVIDEWNVPGRYGWVGGTGTAAHVVPTTDTVAILLTQVELTGPTPPTIMRDFWRVAARGPGN